MAEAYLHDLAYALGERRAEVTDSARAGLLRSDPEALAAAGFRWHHRCSPQTTALDLATCAAARIDRALLQQCSALIYATALTPNANLGRARDFERSRDVKFLMDFPASRLQAALGLAEAAVIGVNQQACTATLGALRLGRALLLAEPAVTQVLCISADRFPDGALYEQSYNLISDGAAACLLSREPRGFRLLACHQITNGGLAQVSDDESVGVFFAFTKRLVEETLSIANLVPADLAWIVPQNMNVRAWQIMSSLLAFPSERLYFEPLPETAHVVGADNIINLKHLDEAGRLLPGERVLLVMAGYGMNWQAALVEKV
jgi:3-oxoacyl-[acyl-carrier-protein] synthase-3